MADLRPPTEPHHLIVVVGGAVAGSEAAAMCAERGAQVVVLERNARPFGKIEDGLPRWHRKLREKEYARIIERLTHPNIHFVPETSLGSDVALGELLEKWRANAVLLASGAWRDRPLPVPGVEEFVGRGLVYQNPLVHWYNHYPDADYRGPAFDVPDGPIVVGGGLASIDVAKLLNLQLYKAALAREGHRVTTEELEHGGILAAIEARGLSADAMEVTPATLFYRRSKGEMPLAARPSGPDIAQLVKAREVNMRLMDKVIERFLVRFEGNQMPVAPLTDGERLTGLRFQRTETVDGRLRPVEAAHTDVHAPMVVSSIGSIPEALPGVPMKGELIDFADLETGRLNHCERVYGLGNALTGRGNIRDSRVNASEIAERTLSQYLGLAQGEPDVAEVGRSARLAAAPAIEEALSKEPRTAAELVPAFEAVSAHWQRVGYAGELARWLARHETASSE